MAQKTRYNLTREDKAQLKLITDNMPHIPRLDAKGRAVYAFMLVEDFSKLPKLPGREVTRVKVGSKIQIRYALYDDPYNWFLKKFKTGQIKPNSGMILDLVREWNSMYVDRQGIDAQINGY